jgi:hypothetical protein
MKEKGLITDKLFEVSELKKNLKNFDTNSDKNSYYKAILQNLFFATLNVPIDDRKWIDGKKRNKAQHGDPLIYRYENEFTNSEDAIENIFMQIPFLNGGLFDCLDDRENEIFIDGFTKNEKKQPKFPNFVFFGTREDVDLSHHFGDDKDELKKWKKNSIIGIIDLLNNFKFTVEENTPLEIDVALDPELLGKVFENLLASFNPETKATARKQTGSFYTPREIVNYMVDESLKQHLKTHLPNLENEIEHLFKNENVDLNDFAKKSIVEKLFECKILDPACGSGAYPMGILHKMVELFNILDSQNFYLKELEGEKLDQLIISAQQLSDTQTRNQTIDALENQKEILKKAEFDYVRKLYIIENCIYGVDIQPIAIQISKLRFFISLLVEQNKKENQKNFGIEALPNMDFKLVAANTLIAPPQEEKGIGLFENQNQFFDRFEKLAHEYFKLRTPEEKRGKKEELKMLIQEKVTEKVQMIRRDEEAHTFNGVAKNKKSELALADLNQSKTLWESYPNLFKEKSVAFFDIPYFFPKVKDGFDVVIGNPPYIGQKGNNNIFKPVKESVLGKQFHQRRMDYFYFFFHQGLNLLKENGVVNFITTNYYITATYADLLRKDFKERSSILQLINFNELKIFESAAGQHNLITLLKKGHSNAPVSVINTNKKGNADAKILQDILNGKDIETSFYTMPNQNIYEGNLNYIRLRNEDSKNSGIDNILEILKTKGKPLGDICTISAGIQTGCDKLSQNQISKYGINGVAGDGIFALSNSEVEALELNNSEINHLKPWFKNSDINKWVTNNIANESLVYYTSKTKNEIGKNLLSHFEKYKPILINRNTRSGTPIITNKIYDLFVKGEYEISYVMVASAFKKGAYYCISYARDLEFFELPKIVVPQRSNTNCFGYNEEKWFASADVYFIIQNDTSVNLKYILTLLNSKIYYYWLYYKGKRKGESLELYLTPLSEIPIKIPDTKTQDAFVSIADKIIEGKKAGQDTSHLEHQIDVMVYHLYGLSYEEACVIDEELKEEDFEKYKIQEK